MKIFFYIFLYFFAVLNVKGDELLSQEKQKLLNEQKNEYEAQSQKLRDNWIAPLNIGASYSYDRSANGGYSDTKKVGASISQDIYRSGGIESQVAYANELRITNNIKWQKDIASLNLELYSLLLNYKKSLYELEQSSIKLKNHDIEIFIKQTLYEAGKSDITELNNALMDRISEQKLYTSLQYTLKKERLEIVKISDIDPDNFEVGEFLLIDEDKYIKESFDIRYDSSQSKTYKHLYNITSSSFQPSISVNSEAGFMEYDPKSNLSLNEYSGIYYGAGVSINIPLTYNASYAKEEAKAAYLKQSAAIADDVREKKASYKQTLELIQSYKDYIDITQKNLKFYDEIISIVEAEVLSGAKSRYDLETLKNTRAIEEYNIKINSIDIKLEIATLYFNTNKSKDN